MEQLAHIATLKRHGGEQAALADYLTDVVR